MTRLLFLPNDQTFLLLDSEYPPAEVVEAVLSGKWVPPEPYGSALAQMQQEQPFKAFQQGTLVVITTVQPLALEKNTTAAPGLGQRSPELLLTPRQTDVLQALAEGMTTKEMARLLHLSERTVCSHISALKQRLGASTRAQSVGRAAALGLCKPSRFGPPPGKRGRSRSHPAE